MFIKAHTPTIYNEVTFLIDWINEIPLLLEILNSLFRIFHPHRCFFD